MFGHFTSQPSLLETTARQRLCAELRRSLTALVLAYFRHPLRQSADIVEQQALALGIDDRDIALVHISLHGKPVVLAAVPTQLWHDAKSMNLLRELKAVCLPLGENVVLVPQSFVLRQPRLDNAMLIAGSRGVAMPMGDRMAVLGHLIENGSATLMELAGRIKHPDPVTALLGLVTAGLIDMDLDRPILPTSVISIGDIR